MGILFSKVTNQTYKRLKSFGYTVNMYDNYGNRTYKTNNARFFFCEPEHIMVYINEFPGTEVFQVNLSSNVNMKDVKKLLYNLRILATRNLIRFETKVYNKNLQPKDFKAYVISEDEKINNNKTKILKGSTMRFLNEQNEQNNDLVDNLLFGYAASSNMNIEQIKNENPDIVKDVKKLANDINNGKFSKLTIKGDLQEKLKSYADKIRSDFREEEHKKFVRNRIFEHAFSELANDSDIGVKYPFLSVVFSRISELYGNKIQDHKADVPVVITKQNKLGVGKTNGQSWKPFLQSIPGLPTVLQNVADIILEHEQKDIEESDDIYGMTNKKLNEWFEQFDVNVLKTKEIQNKEISERVSKLRKRRDNIIKKDNEKIFENRAKNKTFYFANDIVNARNKENVVKRLTENMNTKQKKRLINCISTYWSDDITEKVSKIINIKPTKINENDDSIQTEFKGNVYLKDVFEIDGFDEDDFLENVENKYGVYIRNVTEELIAGSPLNNYENETLKAIASVADQIKPASETSKVIYDYIEKSNHLDENKSYRINESNETITSLNDVYSYGPYQVWFSKPEFKRHASVGVEYLQDEGLMPTKNNLSDTHKYLGNINARDLNDVSVKMQGEYWSPYGEAVEFIRDKGLTHTSFSIGDVICNENDGECYIADMFGFKELPNELEEHVNYDTYIQKYRDMGFEIEVTEHDLNEDSVAEAWTFDVYSNNGRHLLTISEPDEGVYTIDNDPIDNDKVFNSFDETMEYANNIGLVDFSFDNENILKESNRLKKKVN